MRFKSVMSTMAPVMRLILAGLIAGDRGALAQQSALAAVVRQPMPVFAAVGGPVHRGWCRTGGAAHARDIVGVDPQRLRIFMSSS